jgi:hypothetical protein
MTATETPTKEAQSQSLAPPVVSTAGDLFRALKDSGTGETYLRPIRRCIKLHKEREIRTLLDAGVPMDKAAAQVVPLSPAELVVELQQMRDEQGKPVIGDVTMRKCKNLLAGKHADINARVKPEEWDDDIDGPWAAEAPTLTEAERQKMLIRNPPQAETLSGNAITPPIGSQPAGKTNINVHEPSPDSSAQISPRQVKRG